MFDPCYDEINDGCGYTVSTAIYKNDANYPEGFFEFSSNDVLIPLCEVVTHWMYKPNPPEYDPEVLNPIFRFYHEYSFPKTNLKQI